MITLSIAVNRLDKNRFKQVARKDGGSDTYCDLVIFTAKSGKMFVKQQVTKEERLARVEMPILGEAKDWDAIKSNSAPKPEPNKSPIADEDVPF